MARGRNRAAASLPKDADQFNSLHERLIEGWKAIGQGRRVCISPACSTAPEDRGTLAYLEDCARQAGLDTTVMAMDDIGRNAEAACSSTRPTSRSN